MKPVGSAPVLTGHQVNRRRLLSGAAAFAGLSLAGCVTRTPVEGKPSVPGPGPSYALMYGPRPNERFPIPAVNLKRVPSKFYRRQVDYATTEQVGTIIIDTDRFFLFLIQGRARVGWKQQWPKWTPPEEMIARQPELARWSAANGGMPPGLDNPLGARALYIFKNGVDTLYRIHGSPEYWTIGKSSPAVVSG